MKTFLITCIFTFFTFLAQAQNSVFALGQTYKMAIPEHGVYKITHTQLVAMGVDLSVINPRNIHIFGNNGGMLPQPNRSTRPVDLQEKAIYVQGEEDGSFDAQDYILFYAEGANRYFYDANKELFRYENNLYDTQNYIFIKIDDTKGKRIQKRESVQQDAPLISSYDAFQFHEQDIDKIEQDIFSGREWYGERFGVQNEVSIDFPLNGILPNSEVKVVSGVVGRSTKITLFSVFLNQELLGTHRVSSVNPLGIGRYDYKGRYHQEIFTTPFSSTNANDKVQIQLKFDNQGVSTALGLLDFVLLNAECSLTFQNKSMRFRSLKSTKQEVSKFQISNFPSDAMIWDVTDPQNVIWQNIEVNHAQAHFTAETKKLREFQIFQPNELKSPKFIELVNPQNIKNLKTPDLLIITHPKFQASAEKLAEFRRTHDFLTAQVVTTTQIYNEFSSGRQDVTAIRDCIKWMYDRSSRLKYVLLFGDASYDYKNRISNPNNFVPVYQSRESLHPIYSYASDDYYGFMGNDEGFWSEQEDQDEYDLEIGIGRLPVKSEIEATNVVNKLIRYDSPESIGSWRNRICFVADDADYNLHFNDTERIANKLMAENEIFNLNKLYVDAFPQVLKSVEKRSPAMRDELKRTIEEGVLLLNYIGHGSELNWTSEQIFDFAIAGKLQNPHRMPLIVTATCEFGRFDYHLLTGAEYAVLNPNGGAIGMLTTTRPVYSNTNAYLTRAFYNAIFKPINGQMPRLGDVIRVTKNNSLSGIRNRNFSLLGDPSMRLAYPRGNIKINTIKTANAQDTKTLKAFDKVTVRGEIQKNSQLDTDFKGVLDILVFDKPVNYQTLGDEDPEVNIVADYKLQNHKLFKGTTRIENGVFEFEFIVPKDIDYQLGKAKISLYASHEKKYQDAGGFSTDIQVGGTSEDYLPDSKSPDIQIFMDSTNFTSGQTTGTNPKLLGFFSDESGINITGTGLGHDMVAILDHDQVYTLNDFYQADLGTYQSGKVVFPFNNLPEGVHHLEVRAWDTHNNFASKTLTFRVKKAPFALSDVVVYPNPLYEKTQFSFTHNRAGDDLQVTLEIYESTGKKIFQKQQKVYFSTPKVQNLRWNGVNESGSTLSNGLYFYRLSVQPTQSKETIYHVGKLMIMK